jgi:hypothetical protein
VHWDPLRKQEEHIAPVGPPLSVSDPTTPPYRPEILTRHTILKRFTKMQFSSQNILKQETIKKSNNKPFLVKIPYKKSEKQQGEVWTNETWVKVK